MRSVLALITLTIVTLIIGCASSGILNGSKAVYGHLVFYGEVQQVNNDRVVILLDRVDTWDTANEYRYVVWQGKRERTFDMVRGYYFEYPDIGDQVMVTMLLYRNPSSYIELERLVLHILYTDYRIIYKPIIDAWY